MTGLFGYVLLPIAALMAVPWLLHWWFTRPDRQREAEKARLEELFNQDAP